MDQHQRFFLDAMGIQLWERREASATRVDEDSIQQAEEPLQLTAAASPVEISRESSPQKPPVEVVSPVRPAESQPATDDLPAWLDEAPPLEAPMFDLEEAEIDESGFALGGDEPVPSDVASLGWEMLQQRVSGCTICSELVANRTQTVFGVGNKQADWMIIGEAPGADEDKQGEPFVGRAGQLLNAMLQAVGLKREQVYIANVLKCRPPNNRDPEPGEAAACEPYLKRQIALVQPKVILVVGRIAAQNLLKVDTPIGKLRGKVHHYEGTIPLVVTYHPAYLLRSPLEKRKSWADLCLAKSVIEGAD